MATGAPVPLANNPTVLPSASGRTFGPRLDGFNAVQTGALGAEQATAAGSATMDLAMKMQQQADDVRVTGAMNQLMQTQQQLTSDPEQGYMRLKGEAALQPDNSGLSMPQSYTQKLQDAANSLSSSLNPRQQMMFQARAGALINNFNGAANRYWDAQHQEYTVNTANAAISNATNNGTLHYSDPEILAQSQAQIQHAIGLRAQAQGWSPEMVQQAQAQALTGLHEGVISAAIKDGNSTFAAQYFQAHKGEMDAQGVLHASGLIQQDLDGKAAITAVQKTEADFADQLKPGADLPSEEAFVDKAVGQLGDNASSRQIQLVRQEAQARYSMIVRDQSQAEHDVIQRAQRELDQNGGSFAALPPDLRSEIELKAPGAVAQLMEYGKVLQRRGAPNGDGSGFAKHDDPQTFLNLLEHPDQLRGLTDDQFNSLRTKLSEGTMMRFAEARQGLQKGVATQSPNAMNDTVFNNEVGLRLASLYPDLKTMPPAQKATIIGNLRNTIFAEQQAAGRKFDEKELRGAIDRAFMAQATVNNHSWMPFSSATTNKRAVEVTPEDMPADVAAQIRQGYAKAHPGSKPLGDDQVFNLWRSKLLEQ